MKFLSWQCRPWVGIAAFFSLVYGTLITGLVGSQCGGASGTSLDLINGAILPFAGTTALPAVLVFVLFGAVRRLFSKKEELHEVSIVEV
jgi:hypothetical protein